MNTNPNEKELLRTNLSKSDMNTYRFLVLIFSALLFTTAYFVPIVVIT